MTTPLTTEYLEELRRLADDHGRAEQDAAIARIETLTKETK